MIVKIIFYAHQGRSSINIFKKPYVALLIIVRIRSLEGYPSLQIKLDMMKFSRKLVGQQVCNQLELYEPR